MEARYEYAKVAPGVYQGMLGLVRYLHDCGLEGSLLHLVKLRASQFRMKCTKKCGNTSLRKNWQI